MGNLTRITKFRHYSGLTMTASKSLPNSTSNRYAQSPLYPELLTSQANEIQHIKLIIYF